MDKLISVPIAALQFEPAPRRGEPDVTRRTPDYFLWRSFHLSGNLIRPLPTCTMDPIILKLHCSGVSGSRGYWEYLVKAHHGRASLGNLHPFLGSRIYFIFYCQNFPPPVAVILFFHLHSMNPQLLLTVCNIWLEMSSRSVVVVRSHIDDCHSFIFILPRKSQSNSELW